jgi:CSLREA domain-containing protein
MPTITASSLRTVLATGIALGPLAAAATSAHAAQFPVNPPTDPGDGACDATCTLRDAITAANADAAADTITFAGALGTIQPASSLPVITNP